MQTGKLLKHPLITTLTMLSMMAILAFSGCSKEQAKDTPEDVARAILDQSGVRGGLIVHVNCGDGVLTNALKRSDSYLVQGLDSNQGNVEKAREYIMSKGDYGRVSVDRLTDNRLPYTDKLVNLIVADNLGDISKDEVMRVLVPDGVLMTKSDNGWEKTVKPRPAEMDEWNQYFHDAGNSAVSKDLTI